MELVIVLVQDEDEVLQEDTKTLSSPHSHPQEAGQTPPGADQQHN